MGCHSAIQHKMLRMQVRKKDVIGSCLSKLRQFHRNSVRHCPNYGGSGSFLPDISFLIRTQEKTLVLALKVLISRFVGCHWAVQEIQ